MIKKILLTACLSSGSAGSASAESYWLNIPGAYSREDAQYLPAASYKKSSFEACQHALLRYAQTNLIHYIGCDTRPLSDAVNLKPQPLIRLRQLGMR